MSHISRSLQQIRGRARVPSRTLGDASGNGPDQSYARPFPRRGVLSAACREGACQRCFQLTCSHTCHRGGQA